MPALKLTPQKGTVKLHDLYFSKGVGRSIAPIGRYEGSMAELIECALYTLDSLRGRDISVPNLPSPHRRRLHRSYPYPAPYGLAAAPSASMYIT